VFLLLDGADQPEGLLPFIRRMSGVQSSRALPRLNTTEGKSWPMDVLETAEAGMLALRVRKSADLERYGLATGDVLLIELEQPGLGAPAFAAIEDEVVIGSYHPRKADTIAIVPFVKGTAPVISGSSDKRAVCLLRAVVRNFKVGVP